MLHAGGTPVIAGDHGRLPSTAASHNSEQVNPICFAGEVLGAESVDVKAAWASLDRVLGPVTYY